MNQSNIKLRDAVPIFEEGLAFARLANQASEGFMRFMFGAEYEKTIASAFLQSGHDMSYQNVTFAELDNAIVGMILAYTEANHRRATRDAQRTAAGNWRIRMRLVEFFLAPVMTLADSIEPGDYYLQFIAVDPNVRSGGVGSVLLDALEDQARTSGSTRLCLDVSPGNELARPFYEHRGWVIDSTWPGVFFMPDLSVRMTKYLG